MQQDDLWQLPGLGGELQEIYLQTAQVPDIKFSWAAVVALFSVIGSRKYRTPSRNYTPLNMMILARSSSGKNHILHFISECLKQCGLSHLILDPVGCSSKQGLFGVLKRCPSQIFIKDESGHQREANKHNGHDISLRGALMSLVSNPEGTFSLPATSERGLSNKDLQAKREYEKPIQNPGITNIEISTSEKLLRQLSPDDMSSGELGRYIMLCDSGKIPELAKTDPPKIILPDNIRQKLSQLRYTAEKLTYSEAYEAAKEDIWQSRAYTPPELSSILTPTDDDIQSRLAYIQDNEPGFMDNSPDNPNRAPVVKVYDWEDSRIRSDIFLSRQEELLKKYWMSGNAIHSKQHEHAMRLSLIYSLMDDMCRQKHIIKREHALKVMSLINYLIDETDKHIVPQIASSDVSRAVNVAVQAIKEAGEPVGYEAWKNKRAWKELDSTQKKLTVLDSLEDYQIIAIQNDTQTRKGKFNACLYAWVGDDGERALSEFEASAEEAKV